MDWITYSYVLERLLGLIWINSREVAFRYISTYHD